MRCSPSKGRVPRAGAAGGCGSAASPVARCPPSLPGMLAGTAEGWHCHTGHNYHPLFLFSSPRLAALPARRSVIVCMCTRVFEGGRNPNCILLKYYDFFPPSKLWQRAAPPRCLVQLAPTGTCKVVLQVLHQKSFDTVSVIKCTIKRMSAITFNQSVNQIYICKGFLKGLSSKPPLCF